ncbi:Bacterial dnaA protein helix-turn-helix [Hoeflea sp. IMCC20628]|nr:Bacterial dnaA protein helix-turn-helix [Hoeflea sp. IMCC20628]
MAKHPVHKPRRTRQIKREPVMEPSRIQCGLLQAAPISHNALPNVVNSWNAELQDCRTARSNCTLIALAGGRSSAAAIRIDPVDVLRCRIVWRLVTELFSAACAQDLPAGIARRRPRCHRRQVAMYLSHVVLSVPYRSIAMAFGRDRTTVVHACSVTEDRRDDAGYYRFVENCERCINAVFAPFGHDHAEL